MKRSQRIGLSIALFGMWLSIILSIHDQPEIAKTVAVAIFGIGAGIFSDFLRKDDVK